MPKTQSGEKPPAPKQLTKKALQDMIRPHVPEMIRKAIELMNNADNDSVRLGAIKLLMAKVVPDLKAVEWENNDKSPIRVTLKIDEK